MENTKYEVEYQAGESRMEPGVGVDYMLVNIPTEDDDIELYAEYCTDYGDEPTAEQEVSSYKALKQEIIAEAVEKGIDPSCLKFWYDDEEEAE